MIASHFISLDIGKNFIIWHYCCIGLVMICLDIIVGQPFSNCQKIDFEFFLHNIQIHVEVFIIFYVVYVIAQGILSPIFWQYLGNKAKERISKRVFQENKARQRTCAYLGVRNVRFAENLACFVFLKHPFWDLLFCLIIDNRNTWRAEVYLTSSRTTTMGH